MNLIPPHVLIFEGTSIAVIEMTTRFVGEVRFGDTIRQVLKVEEMKGSKKADWGIVTGAIEVRNQKDEAVLQGNWLVMIKRD